MAKQTSPYDFASFFGNFDPTKVMQEFTASVSEFRVPNVDMQAMLDSQRKNLEALTTANRQVLEGMQAIAERQRDILQEAIRVATSSASELSASSASPQQVTEKQAELVKKAIEKALEHMRELAEITAKTNQETFEILNRRFQESMAELRQVSTSRK